MKAYCFGCNIEKDNDLEEVSPFAHEDGLTTEAIPPLIVLDCQGPRLSDNTGYSEYKQVVVCHTCFHALSPDMWISKECWDSINPHVPYEKCPLFVIGRHDPLKVQPLP